MPQVIDIKSTTLVVRPGKQVKFETMMGGGGPSGPAGKNVKFSNKEYANVAKTVVLVGQSLKKLNINVRDMKKLMTEDLKLQKADRAAAIRREREARIERRGGKIPGTGAVKEVAGAGKSLLEKILAPLAGLGNILIGFVGYAGIKKLLQSDFVKYAVNGFANLVGSIVNAVQSVPAEVFSKAGKAIGRFLGFVGNFVGGSIGRAFKGLDQVIDSEGRLRFSLKGIVNLITGIGGIALAFRYLRNPTKIIGDVASVIKFLGSGIAGLARMLPAGADVDPKVMARAKRIAKARRAKKVKGFVKGVKGAPGAIGDFFVRNRVPMEWGGPLPGSQFYDDVTPGVTRGARAISEYGAGAAKAGLRNTPRALAGGARGLMGGIGGAAKAGFTKIGSRIPILGSLLAGGMEFAQSGDLGKAGGAGIGAGLGTAIGAGIGSVIPGAGTVVGGLAGGIIGEFIGKTIGGGVTDIFKGFDFGKEVMKPVGDAFKIVGDSFKPLIDMFLDAFGIGKDGKEKGDSGFVKGLKNIGKVIGIIAKLLLKGLGPTLKVVASLLKYAMKAVTFLIKGVVSVMKKVMDGVVALVRLIPGQGNFSFGSMLDGLSKMIDSSDWSNAGEFAKGGKIFGGKPTGDSVPAFLERGEYVMNRNAVKAVGHRNLDALNFGMFPRFAAGGAIHPKLAAMSDSRIKKAYAAPGMCVTGSLLTMEKSGAGGEGIYTSADVGNNPRGAMVQLQKSPHNWKSIGGTQTLLKSPYGNVNTGIFDKDQYLNLVRSGKIPSGALVFQTRHNSWNGTSYNSRGFDMAIAQKNGMALWNGQPINSPLVYANTKKVAVLTPDGKQGDGTVSPMDSSPSPPGSFDLAPAPTSGGMLTPTANATSEPGITAQAHLSKTTNDLANLISSFVSSGDTQAFMAQMPQMSASANAGSDTSAMMPAGSSAGSIQNNLYEVISMRENG